MMTAAAVLDHLDCVHEAHDRGAIICSLAGMSLKDISTTTAGDVCDDWCPPSSYKAGKSLTSGQVRQLLSLAENQRDFAILYLAVVLGLRQIEIRRLLWSDRLSGDRIRVLGKGGKRRTLPVGTDIDNLFPPKVEFTNHVFASYRGGEISESGMRVIINRYLSEVAPDATPHALRHTALTGMLEQGSDIQTAMEIAGHSTVSSHEIYAATSSSWIVKEWMDKHPLGSENVSTIRVPGRPFMGKMARGVERAVLVPSRYRSDVEAALAYFSNAKQLTNRSRKIGVRFKEIRDLGSVSMTESEAHPFLIAMLVGTTPSNIVRRNFERMTAGARLGRENAITQLGAQFSVTF